MHLDQPFPDAAHRATVADRHHDPVGADAGVLLTQLVDQLQRDRFLSFDQVGIDCTVSVVPAKFCRRFHAQLPGLVISSLHGKNPGAKHQELRHFGLRGAFRHKDRRRQSSCSRKACQRGSCVTGGSAGDAGGAFFQRLDHAERTGPVFKGSRRVTAFIFYKQPRHAQFSRQTRRIVQRRPADLQMLNFCCIFDRQ